MLALSRNGSRIVLVGTGKYMVRGLTQVPAVQKTMRDLVDAFQVSCEAQRSRIKDLTDPRSTAEVGNLVADFAEEAIDSLLFYYVGHGIVSNNGELYLATSTTDARPFGRLESSAVRYATLRDSIKESPASSKVVILDTCFSGRATDGLSHSEVAAVDLADIEGVCVIAAAARDGLALAPTGEEHTAFSGALIRILKNGIAGRSSELTIGDLYNELRIALPRRNCPKPQVRCSGDCNKLTIARNMIFAGTSAGAFQANREAQLANPRLVEILVPSELGSMQEATVLEWRKRRGDRVSTNEHVADLETDKTTFAVYSMWSGVIEEIVVPEHETVQLGDRLAVIRLQNDEI
jgi:biotin carboxyl carrier protein